MKKRRWRSVISPLLTGLAAIWAWLSRRRRHPCQYLTSARRMHAAVGVAFVIHRSLINCIASLLPSLAGHHRCCCGTKFSLGGEGGVFRLIFFCTHPRTLMARSINPRKELVTLRLSIF